MGVATVELVEMTPTRQAVTYSAPGADPVVVWAECGDGVVQDMTPWVAFLAPVAARQGHDLRLVGGTVDEAALMNAAPALGLLASWFPEDLSVPGVAADVHTAEVDGEGVGCFFSGGVDSFYSVLTERERVTHLIFVHGFDVRIDDHDLVGRVLTELRQAADEVRLPLLEVRTNIRSLSDPVGLAWDRHYHGAALGGVAQLVGQHVKRALVPSTFQQGNVHAYGSHPDLDPLWSSTGVEVVHDGAEATRPEKVRTLAQHPVAMARLRVCWQNPDGAYNCGRCEKCTRTLVDLRAVGAQGRCSTLPDRPDLRRVLSGGRTATARTFIREQIEHVTPTSDPVLWLALRAALVRGHAAGVSRRLLRR